MTQLTLFKDLTKKTSKSTILPKPIKKPKKQKQKQVKTQKGHITKPFGLGFASVQREAWGTSACGDFELLGFEVFEVFEEFQQVLNVFLLCF